MALNIKTNESQQLDHHGKCPECGGDWDAGDIVERFKEMRDGGDAYWATKTDQEIIKAAGYYGWTPEDPKRFSRIIGVEIRGVYDGVAKWRCPDCGAEWDRFSNKRTDNGKTGQLP